MQRLVLGIPDKIAELRKRCLGASAAAVDFAVLALLDVTFGHDGFVKNAAPILVRNVVP